MKIHIVLPYPDCETNLYRWAESENSIDFRKDSFEAARCTVSFAATELISYLKKLCFEVEFSSQPKSKATNIYLRISDEKTENEHFVISSCDDGVEILADGRIGILYGVYELLRLQGIRWLNPDDEILPDEVPTALNIPNGKKEYYSDMPLGRGFDFEGLLKDSTKLWLWMARNRLNLSAYRPYTAKFQKKIGMSFKMGGHIFERILDPDRVLSDGKTIWEAHKDWYGINETGERKKESALFTQFCMSNEELLDFLAEELISLLNNDWYNADRIDVWTFDTWGKTCQCPKCRKLGNSTDQTLHFIASMRDSINKAIASGRLDHDVSLVSCSYEGTATLEAPINPIPESIRGGKDYIVYYPILRCYQHKLFDKNCETNMFYSSKLSEWKDIPIMIGEYYNVSRQEDLPLLFKNTMPDDFADYHKNGVRGMTYMHLPMINWGMRNFTQLSYAALCWDTTTDIDALFDEYLRDRYSVFGEKVRKAYELLEKASEYVTQWRAWGTDNILIHLNAWDGNKPKALLEKPKHFKGRFFEIAKENISELEEAILILKKVKAELLSTLKPTNNLEIARNPIELLKQRSNVYLKHLNEDISSLIYGKNVMSLTFLFVQYHDAWYNDAPKDDIWEKIEELSDEMSTKYVPITYINSMDNIELLCKTEFERSHLDKLYYRVKAEKNRM